MELFLLFFGGLVAFGQSLSSDSNEMLESKPLGDQEVSPRPCNRTALEGALLACDHDMINTLVKDHSTSCSTESFRLENCIKNVLVDCYSSYVEQNLSSRETLEKSIDASVKQFKFGQYYCNPGDLNLDWEGVAPGLRQNIPCDKDLFKKVAECGQIFRYVFAENRSDSSLCGLYTNAKRCVRDVYKKYCTVSAPALDTYNPFCPNNMDFDGNETEGVWTRVTRSLVQSVYKFGVEVRYHSDDGGFAINARVTSGGCGNRPGSALLIYIKKKWKYIMYTQEFTGAVSCWRIFGNRRRNRFYSRELTDTPHGLMNFDPKQGDHIWNQQRMGGTAGNLFEGSTYRCDDEAGNFWHARNGHGLRRATVMLRRGRQAPHAGIFTATNCGKPSYVIKDIFIYT